MLFLTGQNVIDSADIANVCTTPERFETGQKVKCGAENDPTEIESETSPRQVLAGKATCCVGWRHLVYQTGSKVNFCGFCKGTRLENAKVVKDINAVSMATSWMHTYIIDRRGECLVWKDCEFEEPSHQVSWQCREEGDKLKEVAAGDAYTIASTEMGRIGVISEESSDTYVYRPLELSVRIEGVSCGKEHVIFLSTIGIVLTMGAASRSQLGHGGTESRAEPQVVAALEGIRMTRVAAGGWHSMAISDIGDLYGWGWNESGQLGLPCRSIREAALKLLRANTTSQHAQEQEALSQHATHGESVSQHAPEQEAPSQHATQGESVSQHAQEGGSISQHAQQVPATSQHASGFSSPEETVNIQVVPRFVEVIHPNTGDEMTLTEVSCGSRHTAVVTDDGQVVTFGWNGRGQLGHGDLVDRDVPTRISSLSDWHADRITCGYWTTVIQATPR